MAKKYRLISLSLENTEVMATPSKEDLLLDDDETIKRAAVGRRATAAGSVSFPYAEDVPGRLAKRPLPVSPTLGLHFYWKTFSWQFASVLFVLIMLASLIGGVLVYGQLQQVQTGLYQVDTRSGAIQWQHPVKTPLHVLDVDAQGSLIVVDTGQHMYQLQAYDRQGTLQWQTLASKQHFFLPVAAPSRTGTVLVAAGERATIAHFDSSLVDHTIPYFQRLSLSLLNRFTGHVLWQKTFTRQSGESVALLGADASCIYAAILQISNSQGPPQIIPQLLAFEQTTGKLVWHISASPSSANRLYDGGKLLIKPGHLIWQVAGVLYKIALPDGTLQWQKNLDEDVSSILFQEESQMAEVAGVVLVARSNAYLALNITSGQQRWLVASPGTNMDGGQSVAGITVVDTTLLIYGGGQIQAVNALTHKVLWSQKELDAIHSLNVSPNGTLVYVTITASIEGSTPVQLLVALDMKNGAAHWTFQPSNSINFLSLSRQGPLYVHSLLVTLICTAVQDQRHSTCVDPWLYALNATTGAIVWKREGLSITDVHASADDQTLLFQLTSSPWLNFVQGFRS